jgi:hypothetical protein
MLQDRQWKEDLTRTGSDILLMFWEAATIGRQDVSHFGVLRVPTSCLQSAEVHGFGPHLVGTAADSFSAPALVRISRFVSYERENFGFLAYGALQPDSDTYVTVCYEGLYRSVGLS